MIDLEMLKREIFKLAEKPERYKEREYHITELIYCLAKAYLHRKYNIPYLPNGKILSGLLLHEKLPEILPKLMDGEISTNVPCQKQYQDYSIVGEADAVNCDTVYEFKYTSAKLSGTLPFYYCLQANAYACLLNKPKFCIIYINSYTLEPEAIEHSSDISLFSILEKQAEYLHNCIMKDILPPGPMYDWECQYCKVKNLCSNYIKQ